MQINTAAKFILYTNLDRLRDYMLDLSRKIQKPIHRFIHDIHWIAAVSRATADGQTTFFSGCLAGNQNDALSPFLFIIMRRARISNFQFAKKFKSPFLREVFENLFDNDEVKMLVFNFSMAFRSAKCRLSNWRIIEMG